MSTTIERYIIRHIAGSKNSQVEEFDYNKTELTIGRAAGSDIQFDPEKETIVSREHGKIVKMNAEPPKFMVVDNNSRNGIFINKSRVTGSAEIHPGDQVQLGKDGPVFSFDIFPRPQNMMMATREVEIPVAIKPTVISEVKPSANHLEPVKTGLGKQTVERMLMKERSKSYSTMAIVIGTLVVLTGVVGFTFRKKLFPAPVVTTIVNNKVDSSKLNKKAPDVIARENDEKVVQIEFGWQIYESSTSDEIWHQYIDVNPASASTPHYQAVYIQNERGQIEPYLGLKKDMKTGVPIGIAGASGSGFVVSPDGFILTNRHIAAGWNTRYDFPEFAFPGVLMQNVNGKMEVVPGVEVTPAQVFGWVPAEATMLDGEPIPAGVLKGRNTYMNVIFANTSLRRPVQSATPSDNHDVALIKVEIPEPLSEVKMKDQGDITPGQSVTVMGFPGVAPEQYIVRKSNDPFNAFSHFTSVPTPTVTPGSIGRIIQPTSEKNGSYSSMGDSYQLTINATGAGNSGGPLFDDEGNVVGIYYATRSDARGALISFAVPIKYGLELMGRKKMVLKD